MKWSVGNRSTVARARPPRPRSEERGDRRPAQLASGNRCAGWWSSGQTPPQLSAAIQAAILQLNRILARNDHKFHNNDQFDHFLATTETCIAEPRPGFATSSAGPGRWSATSLTSRDLQIGADFRRPGLQGSESAQISKKIEGSAIDAVPSLVRWTGRTQTNASPHPLGEAYHPTRRRFGCRQILVSAFHDLLQPWIIPQRGKRLVRIDLL